MDEANTIDKHEDTVSAEEDPLSLVECDGEENGISLDAQEVRYQQQRHPHRR